MKIRKNYRIRQQITDMNRQSKKLWKKEIKEIRQKHTIHQRNHKNSNKQIFPLDTDWNRHGRRSSRPKWNATKSALPATPSCPDLLVEQGAAVLPKPDGSPKALQPQDNQCVHVSASPPWAPHQPKNDKIWCTTRNGSSPLATSGATVRCGYRHAVASISGKSDTDSKLQLHYNVHCQLHPARTYCNAR